MGRAAHFPSVCLYYMLCVRIDMHCCVSIMCLLRLVRSVLTFLFNEQETKEEALRDRVWSSCAWGVWKHCKFVLHCYAVLFWMDIDVWPIKNDHPLVFLIFIIWIFSSVNPSSLFKIYLFFICSMEILHTYLEVWMFCRLDTWRYPIFLCWYLLQNGRGMLVIHAFVLFQLIMLGIY